ncbi:BspA family leucine-rich repeat surface protein, partial [Lactococcus garvieae]|uniref:BspA family leucine-rich repeat surface protein n=2 Tax=Lactococcus garvieae TaxID=1363 RepID=UPI002FE48891
SSSDNSEASTPEVSSSSSNNSEASTPEVSSSLRDGETIVAGTLDTCSWRIKKVGGTNILYLDGGVITTSHFEESPFIQWADQIQSVYAAGDSVVIEEAGGEGLFRGLKNVKTMNLIHLDTSQAKGMSAMFTDMSSLEELDVSKFDTSKVSAMNSMFRGTSSLKKLDVSNFDTSKVRTMSSMFSGMSSLEELDVSKFDTSNVSAMNSMFSGTSSLKKLDVSNFATSKVSNMNSMFSGTSSLKKLDVSNFDTSKVSNMGNMFSDMSSLSQIDLSTFDTSSTVSLQNLFARDYSLEDLDLSHFKTEKVTQMNGMFNGMKALKTLDISGFDMAKVANTTSMFYMTPNLSQITLGQLFKFGSGILPDISKEGYTGNWINVGSGTILNPKGKNVWTSQEFANRYNGNTDADTYVWQEARMKGTAPWEIEDNGTLRIYAGDFDNSQTSEQLWQKHSSDITKIVFDGPVIADTSLRGLFLDLNHVESIVGMEFLDTKNTTDMSRMFDNMSSLSSLDVTDFKTSKVQWMGHMFRGDEKLEFLDVSHFATSQVTDMTGMFEKMSSLTKLDLSSFDTSKVTVMWSMFGGANKISRLRLGENFEFKGNVALPSVPTSDEYNGKWRNVASGTVDKPNGNNIWTSEELMTNYSGMRDADTYVWQKKSFITEYYYDTEGNSLKDPVVTEVDGTIFTPQPEKFEEINDTLYLYKGWSEEQPESGTSITGGNPASTTEEATYYYVYEKADKFINVTIPTEIVFGTEDHSKNITSKNYSIKNNSNDVDLQMTLATFDKVNSDIQLLDEATPDPSVKENSARLNLLIGGETALSSLNEKVSEQELGNIQSGNTTTLALTGTYFGDLSERHKVEYKTNLKFKAQAKVKN